MLCIEHETRNEHETAEWGRALARALRPGDVVRLDGPLGAGKTTLVRSVAVALGADPALVSSPTFVIANEYPLPEGRHLVHVDAYRLAGADDLDAIGWDRMAPHAMVVVEWAERLGEALPADAAQITIDVLGEDDRRLELEAPDEWRSRRDVEHLGAGVVRCPTTGIAVAPGDPHYPFASERARMADLHGWMSESYRVERPIAPDDLE